MMIFGGQLLIVMYKKMLYNLSYWSKSPKWPSLTIINDCHHGSISIIGYAWLLKCWFRRNTHRTNPYLHYPAWKSTFTMRLTNFTWPEHQRNGILAYTSSYNERSTLRNALECCPANTWWFTIKETTWSPMNFEKNGSTAQPPGLLSQKSLWRRCKDLGTMLDAWNGGLPVSISKSSTPLHRGGAVRFWNDHWSC